METTEPFFFLNFTAAEPFVRQTTAPPNEVFTSPSFPTSGGSPEIYNDTSSFNSSETTFLDERRPDLATPSVKQTSTPAPPTRVWDALESLISSNLPFNHSSLHGSTSRSRTDQFSDSSTDYSFPEVSSLISDNGQNSTLLELVSLSPPAADRFNWTSPARDLFMTKTFLSNLTAEESENVTLTYDLTPLLTLLTSPTPQLVVDESASHVSWVDVGKVLVLTLISVLGFLGNVKAIWSVVKERHLHRPPFYFLLSLGVTDLSRAVFCVPVVIATVLHGARWSHGESACKLFAFATSFFVFSSALSLLAIAIDRHISIVYSKTYRRRSLGVANLVAAIVIWVIAFSVSFPPVVGVGDYVFIPDEAQCAYQHKHYSHNDAVASVLVFLVILFLTYFLYFRIFRFLRAHRRMRPLQHTPARSSSWAFLGPGANGQAFINWLNGFGGQVPARHGGQRTVQRLNFGRVVNLSTAKNEHLTRLFLVLTLVFGVSWAPYVILSLWRIFFDTTSLPSAYVTAAAWLAYGQVAVCPIVYFLCRGHSKKVTRTVYSHAEKREFLLENKIGK